MSAGGGCGDDNDVRKAIIIYRAGNLCCQLNTSQCKINKNKCKIYLTLCEVYDTVWERRGIDRDEVLSGEAMTGEVKETEGEVGRWQEIYRLRWQGQRKI